MPSQWLHEVNMWPILLLSLCALLCGSLPFAVWVGHWLLGSDIRQYGDANPGATNVLRAGGKAAAALALTLDFLKGALPVGLAHLWLNIQGWPLIIIAVLPVVGHAFSPFLRFRGGKAVAVTGGIWCGLTLWEGPTVGGLLLGLFVMILAVDGWSVILALGGLLAYLTLTPPDWNMLMVRPSVWVIVGVWLGNISVVAWKHRAELQQPLRLKDSLRRRP